MEAWHGGPENFKHFDHVNFGKGERGREAGWGLYFSEFKPGGQWFTEQYFFSKGIPGFLYHVELEFNCSEILSIDNPDDFPNKDAYSKASSIFPPRDQELTLRPAYTRSRLILGEEEAAQGLKDIGIKVIHSGSQKKPTHGHSFIVIDHKIITILNKFLFDQKGLTKLEV